MASESGAAFPPAPSVDWLTISRHALDHIGLQGPSGALLSEAWLETGCTATLVPHIWRVLSGHAELRFFSGAEQAGWRDWDMVDRKNTPMSSEQLAALELDEVGRLRALPSRRLHAKALRAGEHYESFFQLKAGSASDQWRALYEIGRRGSAGVLQNELCRVLDTPSKHLFYNLSVLQRLGLIVKEERKLCTDTATRVTITSIVHLTRFKPPVPAIAQDVAITAAADADAARVREICLATADRGSAVPHSELRHRLGLVGHDQRRQWERVRKKVMQFADVEVVTRRMPTKKGGESTNTELCFSFAAREAAPRLLAARLDQMPLQQYYAAVRDAGAAGVLNPELRKERGVRP